MPKEWLLSIHDRCDKANVPIFFEQWGGVRKSKAGRDPDGPTCDGLPTRVGLPVQEPGGRLAAIAGVGSLHPSRAVTNQASLFAGQ